MYSMLFGNYNKIIKDNTDYRVKNWLFMGSPLYVIGISLIYPFVAKVLGPWIMRDRKPFQLQNTLIIYNFVQILFSTWIFSYGWNNGVWSRAVTFQCKPFDYSTSPETLMVVRGCWWFFISKFPEFLDTFFFIMRKKYNQVSTLHVIHHGIMPLSVWVGSNFAPGLDSLFVSNVNSFVHMVMYTYYMLSAIGPHVQKYLWWKKYLTVLQLVQFIMVFGHALKLLLMGCDYPKAYCYLILFNSVLFFFLFFNFYRHSYIKNDRKKKAVYLHKKTDDCANTYVKPCFMSLEGQKQGLLTTFASFEPVVHDDRMKTAEDTAYSKNDDLTSTFIFDDSSIDNKQMFGSQWS